ncbi:MAG: hypothetical protein CL607_12430, partial [Anaerolineaceae bacterium]|nr:hypothetical protein [Anaerolineaceae bacterium]
MPVSRDTLLRTLRSKTTLTKNTSDLDEPRIIGIDDWAKRKGQTYGTIIVDLERHQVIDLLPDREPQTVATWLSQHPNIEIVARDRSAQYALGMHQGAPQATQVTDRWHLLKNLWDVIERSLISAKRDKNKLKNTRNKPKDYPREPLPRSAPEEAYRQVRREQRIQQYHQVHYLRERGLSTRRIAQLM